MKLCPKCNTQLEDSAAFCPNCGTQFIPNATVTQQPYIPVDSADHTAEYDPADISQNKLFAAICYILSMVGIIIALLAAKDSPFVQFHVRQSLKLAICEILLGLIAIVGAITIIAPILAWIALIVLVVVEIICFFRALKGRAVEAPIVKGLNFLK